MFSILLLVSAAQSADFKPAGVGIAEAVVELPLYSGVSDDDPFWYIEGKIGAHPVLLRIATEAEGLTLTPAAAARASLKLAGKEGEQTSSGLVVALGSAGLHKVKARIGPVNEFGYGVDGVVGIAAFPELAWAVEPSKGSVKVGPSGASSVADSVGEAVAFTQWNKAERKVGNDKMKIGATALAITAKVSGVEVPVVLASGRLTSRVAREAEGADWFALAKHPNVVYALPPVDGAWSGETEIEWREVGVGGVSVWTEVERSGSGLRYPLVLPGHLGQDVLARSSLGLDAGRKTIALAAGAPSAAASYADILGVRLKVAAEAAAAEGLDADTASSALVGKLTPWIDFLLTTGQPSLAVEPAKRVAEARPGLCTGWHTYGTAQLASGDAAGAVASLGRAAELYQAWAKRPLPERSALAASEGKRSKAADFDGLWAQAHSCHTAWGHLASAQLVRGNPAAVAQLYPQHRDLDVGLPLAAGTALLRLGNPAGAEAAFRQAVQLSLLGSAEARGGMMLATRARSPKLALAQVGATPLDHRGELRFLHTWAEILRADGGSDAVVAALRQHLAQRPGSAAGWLVLASEQAGSGASPAESLAAAERLLSAAAAVTPRSAEIHALRGELLRLAGKLDEAGAAAEKATTLSPGLGLGWYVRSLVSGAAGQAERAAEMRKQAAACGVANPLYASLVAGS